MPTPLAEELSRPECDALLRGGWLGRVIYTDRVLPACTPVNYAVDGHSVVFRVRPNSRLASATDNQVVAFEIDAIDATTGSGWTVLVTGTASPITAVSELIRVEQLGLTPWAPGETAQWVRLAPGIVAGRSIRSAIVEQRTG